MLVAYDRKEYLYLFFITGPVPVHNQGRDLLFTCVLFVATVLLLAVEFNSMEKRVTDWSNLGLCESGQYWTQSATAWLGRGIKRCPGTGGMNATVWGPMAAMSKLIQYGYRWGRC